jgi:molybdopterin converting factor small subunit
VSTPPRVVVHVGSVLLEYTGGRVEVAAQGATPAAVLRDLDRRYPGLRWRVVDEQERLRPHLALFVDGAPCRPLDRPLRDGAVLHLLQALSGG